VILELEDAIRQWGTDTDEDQGAEQARAVMRSLIGRLGAAARSGQTGQTGQADIDPTDRLRPAVQPLIALRAALREEGRFAAADTIREALAAAGLNVRDTPGGTLWRAEGER
jgi:cysteinyl-tRNA synthetase